MIGLVSSRARADTLPLVVDEPRADVGTQLTLIGEPKPVRLPADLWRTWLTDPAVIARFHAKYLRLDADDCWPWIGAVSSTGHGSFRAASLPGRSRRGTVPAHLFAFQLACGVVPRLGWTGANDPLVCHRCDFAGCVNPTHLRLGTATTNRQEWAQRRHDPHSPLADTRGAAGRTRAIAAAVRRALTAGADEDRIRMLIQHATDAGFPLTLW